MNTHYADINFPDGQTQPWIGRNGYFKSKAIALTKSANNTVMIEPITTRGVTGRCLIEFPTSIIPEVIKFLQANAS